MHEPPLASPIHADEARAAGIPPERRALGRRAIRNWTIGTIVSWVLLGAVVAVAHSRAEATDAPARPAPLRPDVVYMH